MLLLHLVLLLGACERELLTNEPDADPEPGSIASIEVSPSAPALTSFGETVVLTALVRDEAGETVPEVNVTWTTSDEALVTLKPQGAIRVQVTAVANGVATITASVAGDSSQAAVLVNQQAALIIPTPRNPVVELPGDTLRISTVVQDARGNTMPEVPVTWQTSREAIATVEENLVRAQGFGTATLTATAGAAQTDVMFEVVGDRFFLSDGARLRYDLDLPTTGPGPFPAIVYIHGSGPVDRNRDVGATDPLLAEGLAVFRYDKRGVGESTGIYTDQFINDRRLTLTQDAAAAVRLLKRLPGIDENRIGLMGNSQGGWIGPPVAVVDPTVSFMLMWSGPTVSVGLELFYSTLAEGTTTPLDSVYQQLAGYNGMVGYDPLPTLEQVNIPSLWLYGGMDRSIPVRLDTLNMRHLQALGKPFEYILYPNADHALRDVDINRFEDVWSAYLAWLRSKGIL